MCIYVVNAQELINICLRITIFDLEFPSYLSGQRDLAKFYLLLENYDWTSKIQILINTYIHKYIAWVVLKKFTINLIYGKKKNLRPKYTWYVAWLSSSFLFYLFWFHKWSWNGYTSQFNYTNHVEAYSSNDVTYEKD